MFFEKCLAGKIWKKKSDRKAKKNKRGKIAKPPSLLSAMAGPIGIILLGESLAGYAASNQHSFVRTVSGKASRSTPARCRLSGQRVNDVSSYFQVFSKFFCVFNREIDLSIKKTKKNSKHRPHSYPRWRGLLVEISMSGWTSRGTNRSDGFGS